MKIDLLGTIPTIIILLLIGFIVRFLLNSIKALKHKLIIKWVLTVITTIFVYLIGVFIIFNTIFNEAKINFDASLWKNKREMRYQMVDDLIEDKVLIGKSRQEVVTIIGKPDVESDDVNRWSFDLGMSGSGLGFKFMTMEVVFSNDKVTDVKKIEILD